MPPPLIRTVLLLADAPTVLRFALNRSPPLAIVRLLPTAPLLPTTSEPAESEALLLTSTVLPVAAPLPTVKLPGVDQVEFPPVTSTAWLLQPLPTM